MCIRDRNESSWKSELAHFLFLIHFCTRAARSDSRVRLSMRGEDAGRTRTGSEKTIINHRHSFFSSCLLWHCRIGSTIFSSATAVICVFIEFWSSLFLRCLLWYLQSLIFGRWSFLRCLVWYLQSLILGRQSFSSVFGLIFAITDFGSTAFFFGVCCSICTHRL